MEAEKWLLLFLQIHQFWDEKENIDIEYVSYSHLKEHMTKAYFSRVWRY